MIIEENNRNFHQKKSLKKGLWKSHLPISQVLALNQAPINTILLKPKQNSCYLGTPYNYANWFFTSFSLLITPKEEVSVSFTSETIITFVETSLINSYCSISPRRLVATRLCVRLHFLSCDVCVEVRAEGFFISPSSDSSSKWFNLFKVPAWTCCGRSRSEIYDWEKTIIN